MSAAHDDAHAHAPEQPEVSHPLLWSALILAIMAFLTWLFFHYLFHGMHVARHHEKIVVHKEAAEVEPDHQKLSANNSQEVIDAGAAIYVANCASCHGAQGNTNPTNLKPAPRNFHTDAWKNPNGGSPYALYLVLTKGLGTMPAYAGKLSPEQRYAVNHYITETWTRKINKAHYVAENPPELKKQIPPPGAASGEGGERHPERVESKAPVRPLLASLAQHGDAQAKQVRTWAALARSGAKPETVHAAERFVALVDAQPALGQLLHSAVKAGDRTRFEMLLAGSDGSGAVRPDFSLASADQLGGLFELLKGVK
jgi:mono/diheme cytochrome c family protein